MFQALKVGEIFTLQMMMIRISKRLAKKLIIKRKSFKNQIRMKNRLLLTDLTLHPNLKIKVKNLSAAQKANKVKQPAEALAEVQVQSVDPKVTK